MSRSLTFTLAILALLPVVLPTPAAEAAVRRRAAARKPVPKRVVPAVIAKPAAPIIPGGFMTPKAVTLRATTPAEVEANAVWNVRAALNVAALQCQFSRFLRTVNNYNDLLRHHGEELTRAQQTMLGHFRRHDKARAANGFDQYTTRTYNSYSTLDAQYRFCDVAGWVGRRVLALPKGQLGRVAVAEAGEVRASLAYQALAPGLAVMPVALLVLPPLEAADEIAAAQP